MQQEEDAKLAWNPNWTWRNMPVKSDCVKIEGTWSFSSYQPSYTWTWPSSKKPKRREQLISEVAAFGRVIEYLMVCSATNLCYLKAASIFLSVKRIG